TEGDEDNLVACQVAQHRFHVGRVIARVNNPKNERIFRTVGVTPTVNAVDALANGVLHEVPGRKLNRLVPFRQGALNLLGVKIPPNASSVGKRISEIALPESTAVALVVHREGRPMTPSDDVVLEPDDEVIALGRPEDERALVEALTR
ncbi:MAG: TrkA C-terminal domain-containing protein, partial [Dehalococcoidia bacterium]